MKQKLSFKEKYSYGVGAIGKDMCCGIIFTYCMLYYTDVLKLSAAFVGTLFFAAKFWDAVNDLGMGMIVDNTHTKWGKFRPWLVIGTLINAVVLVCLFTDWGLSGISLYVFAVVMYVLWGMTYTIMDIPYWSMLPNLTSDPEERDRIAVIPRIFASVGNSVLIGGFGLQLGTVTVVLADVVDYGEYKLGTRNESVIFSIQTLLVKFSSALGALFTGFILDLTGYVPDAVQSMATLNGIRFIMIGLPIVFVIVSFIIYKKYYILNTQYMTRIMNILFLRKEENNKVMNEEEIHYAD